jgi:predicted ATPase
VANKQASTGPVGTGPTRPNWIRAVPGRDAPVAHNLPAPLTSFVGRDHDLADVRRLLSEHRLVTLTGVGGVGKTRLALEAAAGLLDAYLDGVRFVELAAVVDPQFVSQAVAAAFDDIGEQPDRSLADHLAEKLRPRELLLVLDNCEHLSQACAELVYRLLRACPDVRVLATSREALGIAGETVWSVAPLDVPVGPPAVRDAERHGALRLSVERSRARKPDFAVTDASLPSMVEICRRLDGIPLAIELAAAWIPTLTVDELAARLDGQFRLLTGAARRRCRAIRRCGRWWTGATTSCPRRSGPCCACSRCSRAAGPWRRPKPLWVMGHPRVAGCGFRRR